MAASIDQLSRELVALVLENVDSFRSLYSAIIAWPEAYAQYRHAAPKYLRLVLTHADGGLRGVTARACRLHFGSAPVRSWTLQAGESAADTGDYPEVAMVDRKGKRTTHDALYVLERLADMEHEIALLTPWCLDHLQNVRLHDDRLENDWLDDDRLQDGSGESRDLIHANEWTSAEVTSALWHIYILTNIAHTTTSTSEIPAGAERRLSQYLTTKYLQKNFSNVPTLVLLDDLIQHLLKGQAAVTRHQLTPHPRNLIARLCTPIRVQSDGKYFVYLYMSLRNGLQQLIGMIRHSDPSIPSARYEWSRYGLKDEQDRGALDKIQYGDLLWEEDETPYCDFLRDGGWLSKDYLERFRPLLGLPFLSTLSVSDLVGKGRSIPPEYSAESCTKEVVLPWYIEFHRAANEEGEDMSERTLGLWKFVVEDRERISMMDADGMPCPI